MTNIRKTSDVLLLRAHHICCTRFWRMAFDERGPAFVQSWEKTRSILLSHPDFPIMVVEGIDELCRQCPLCRDERCTSADGSEDEVRKWDALLLRELAVPFGCCLTSGEWQKLINKKIPFRLCRRCQWKQICSVGADLL